MCHYLSKRPLAWIVRKVSKWSWQVSESASTVHSSGWVHSKYCSSQERTNEVCKNLTSALFTLMQVIIVSDASIECRLETKKRWQIQRTIASNLWSAHKCNKPTRERKELYKRNEDIKNQETLRFNLKKVWKIYSKERKYKSGFKVMKQKNRAKSRRRRGRGTCLDQSASNMKRSRFKSPPTDDNRKLSVSEGRGVHYLTLLFKL